MDQHEVRLMGTAEEESELFGNSTKSAISVEPPLAIGSLFGEVVLGAHSRHVGVERVFSTAERTIIFASSDHKNPEERQAHMALVSERIGRLANSPDEMLAMLQEAPFARPPRQMNLGGGEAEE